MYAESGQGRRIRSIFSSSSACSWYRPGSGYRDNGSLRRTQTLLEFLALQIDQEETCLLTHPFAHTCTCSVWSMASLIRLLTVCILTQVGM